MRLDTTRIQFIQTHTWRILSSKYRLILSSHLHTGNLSDLSFRFSEQHFIRIPGFLTCARCPINLRLHDLVQSKTAKHWFKPLLRYCIWKTPNALKMCMIIEILSARLQNLNPTSVTLRKTLRLEDTLLLGLDAASLSLPAFWTDVLASSSRGDISSFWTFWPLKIKTQRCLEKMEKEYPGAQRRNPE